MTSPRQKLSGIQVLNRQRRFKINRESVALFCSALLEALGEQGRTLSIVFLNDVEIRALNSRYRQRDCATDVLSFSYGVSEAEGRSFLGEIVIAPVVAARHAKSSGTSLEKELRTLLVHGVLHLLGYDHETDGGEMNRYQRRLLRRRFFLQPGPILRSEMTK